MVPGTSIRPANPDTLLLSGPERWTLAAEARSPEPVIPLREVEKRAILNALTYTRGDRQRAATLLGIGRTTLYRKLIEYEL